MGNARDGDSHNHGILCPSGIELTQTLKTGDLIHTRGYTADMELTVESLQVENSNVSEASAGRSVGVKVSDRVRRGDKVYKIID